MQQTLFTIILKLLHILVYFFMKADTCIIYLHHVTVKLVSHQETIAWKLLATLATAFLNDCLMNLPKYLAIVVFYD